MLDKLNIKGPVILLSYVFLILLLHVIPFGSSMTALNKAEVASIRMDYLLHALVFLPWAIIVWWVYSVNFFKKPGKALLWLFAGVILAAGAEYIQYFLPYRAFNINDVIGNVSGVVLGSVVFLFKK